MEVEITGQVTGVSGVTRHGQAEINLHGSSTVKPIERINDNNIKARLRSQLSKGISEYENRQLTKSIATFNLCISIAGKAAAKFPDSSTFYNSITNRALSYITKAKFALEVIGKLKNATNAYKSGNYRECISLVNSFLQHDLISIGFADYIPKAHALKQQAIEKLKVPENENVESNSSREEIPETTQESTTEEESHGQNNEATESVSISGLTVSPSNIYPGRTVTVSGVFQASGLSDKNNNDLATSVSLDGSTESIFTKTLINISNGTYPFSHTFTVPVGTKSGIKLVSASATLNNSISRKTNTTLIVISKEAQDTENIESFLEESFGIRVVPEQQQDEPIQVEEENLESPEAVFAYLKPLQENKGCWPEDNLTVNVPFSVYGLKPDAKAEFSCSINITDIGSDSKTKATSKKDNMATFNFHISKNIKRGWKTININLRWKGGSDSSSTKFYIYNPRIWITHTGATPGRIKPGEKVTLEGKFIPVELKVNEKINIHASFVGNNIPSIGGEYSAINRWAKSHIATINIPKTAKEGTYHFKFITNSDLGRFTKSGSFIVGRSDEEIREEQARVDRERREREEQQRREEENRRRERQQNENQRNLNNLIGVFGDTLANASEQARSNQQEYDDRSRNIPTNNRNNSSTRSTTDTSSRKKSWCVYYYDRGRGSMKDVGYRGLSSTKSWQRNVRSHQKIYIEATFYTKESAIRYLCSKLSQPQMHGYGYAAKYKGGVTLIPKDIYKMIGGRVK